jgi:hypothetical protein
MPEGLQMVLSSLALVAVYLLTRVGIAWRIRRAARGIIRDLVQQGALDEITAVPLPYERRNWLRIGLRDFRPRALRELVAAGIVGRTLTGGYFLRDHSLLEQMQDHS